MEIKAITRTKDRHGDTVTSSEVTLSALGFAIHSTKSAGSDTSLSSDHNNQIDRRATIYFPPGTPDFNPTVLFKLREHPGAEETTWGIDGGLVQWAFPFDNWDPGFEVNVKRVTG